VREIAEWLAKLGMSEYAQRFAENRIDFTVLRDLSDQDLKELGIVLGDRRKILRAIEGLDGSSPAATAERAAAAAVPSVPAPAEMVPAPSAAEADGERRYLTVMFCDLVGSTAISAQLDAEEWRDLVGAYLDAASAAVNELGGHVAKKLGDGLLALFGYPLAHENNAERAARAALSIQRALATLNAKNAGSGKPELAARIGIETGPAVVDAAGEIYGDVANIAARVQALAEPGAILISARVQRQIAGLFVVEDRGPHALKGLPEATVLFRLVRASGGGRHSGQRNLTPLIGRDDEMAVIMRRWERTRAGDGQLVLIVGEPGLGKSRLIEEFHARLRDVPHTWVEWSCSPLLQNTPLRPIAEWGRARFGGGDVPVERRLAELESSLAQVKLDPAEIAPLVAPLVDIPLPKERVPNLTPEDLRRRQLAALSNWVMAGARVQPIVLAFEDLHWADPTTLDVLRSLTEQGALAPLFILATLRPEFRPPWSMRSHHGTISLAPLDRAQVRDMVAELSVRHALPTDTVEDVASRTGGVPLFVEEVTRLLLERGEQGTAQAIPPTLQQSLMARLDRLGPARDVAHIASVIGRGFSYDLLRAVGGIEDASLHAALEKLGEADILLTQGLPPHADYRFKHALIQDVAYENLLKSRRQALHRRVAEALRDQFADIAAAEPEVLAHHFTQAGLTDAAIEWWGKAGDQALRGSAFQEAISHLGKAIEMADKAGDAGATHRVKLQTDYAQAMLWSKGYLAPETAAAFKRAQELAGRNDTSGDRLVALYGQWAGQFMRAELQDARYSAELFISEAKDGTGPAEALAFGRMQGLPRLLQGEFESARDYLQEALRIDDSELDRETKLRYGVESASCAGSYLALTLWQLGEFDQARRVMQEAIARAVASGHFPTQAIAYYVEGLLEMLFGHVDAAVRAAQSVVEMCREHGISHFLICGTLLLNCARSRAGNKSSSPTEMREALSAYIASGTRSVLPMLLGFIAEVEAEAENFGEASTRVDEALALARQNGEGWTDSLLHRIRGEILLKRDPSNPAPAEEAFLTAISIARQQKAKSFELQAALALAGLYQSSGRDADAYAVIAAALEGLTPTPEFPEIEQGHRLLGSFDRSLGSNIGGRAIA
jgi:class 3 adenylate cyclase/tetratricopeptide (TPR) repeat protein